MFEQDDDHMIPLDEFDDHQIGSDCKCNPEYMSEDGHSYWRHFRMKPLDAMEYLANPDNINLN
jgi:hypothetical protein